MQSLAAAQKVPELHLKLRRRCVLKCEVSVPKDVAGMYCASHLCRCREQQPSRCRQGRARL